MPAVERYTYEQVTQAYEEVLSNYSYNSDEEIAERLKWYRKTINKYYPWYWAFKYKDSYWIQNMLVILMGG